MNLVRNLIVLLIFTLGQICVPAFATDDEQTKARGMEITVTSLAVYLESGSTYNLLEISLAKPRIEWVSANEGTSVRGALSDYIKPSSLRGELPDKTVYWGKNVRKNHFLSADIHGHMKKCPLAAQDLAIITRGNKTKQIPILGYEDCPVFVDPTRALVVLDDLAFEEEYILRIVEAKDNVLQTSSKVPFVLGLASYEIFGSAANARNCVWQFAKKGISFTAAGNKYVSQKEGAEIRFTKDGIKLDGMTASQ